MRRWAPTALFCSLAILEPCPAAEAPRGLCINEISAMGVGHDWVELYNASQETIDSLPLVLRDTLDSSGNESHFCVAGLKPGGWRIVTCPNLLNGAGEDLALFDLEGHLLDSVRYGRQNFNLSFSRRTDGAADWCYQYPTEREPNGSVPEEVAPLIVAAPFHWPVRPVPEEPVFVSAAVVAAAGVASVEILYCPSAGEPGPDAQWQSAPCTDDGAAPDEQAADGRYTGAIPAHAAGTAVHYRLHARDRAGNNVIAPSVEESFAVRFGYEPPPIRINEILASNHNVCRYKMDEKYHFSDWIELYNGGDVAVDLTGWSLSDRRTTSSTFPLLGKGLKVIPAKGYLLIWAKSYFPEEIPDAIGVNFSLSRNGEEVVLFAEDGFSVVDEVAFPQLPTDKTYGRVPEGTGDFQVLESPTPQGGVVYPPRRAEVLEYAPLLPTFGETITIKAWISPDVPAKTVEVYHWLMEEGRAPLFDDGTHGDSVAGDNVYSAEIGPFQDAGSLHFAIELEASDGTVFRDPEKASAWYQIPISWQPQGAVQINEVFAACHLCCCGCLAFQSVTGPLEPRNFVEVRNTGSVPVGLGSLFLTDDPLDYEKVALAPPDYKDKLASGGCFVAWYYAGDDTIVVHPEGGTLFLTDGMKVLDAVTYGASMAGQSYGYLPQDSGSWGLGDPSPGSSNGDSFFLRADANADLKLNLTDAIRALLHLFGDRPAGCLDALDADDDGAVTITDPLFLLSYLFRAGAAPPAPFPDLGPDSTLDSLDCRGFEAK